MGYGNGVRRSASLAAKSISDHRQSVSALWDHSVCVNRRFSLTQNAPHRRRLMPNSRLLVSSFPNFGGLLRLLGVAAFLLAAFDRSPLLAQGPPFDFSPYRFRNVAIGGTPDLPGCGLTTTGINTHLPTPPLPAIPASMGAYISARTAGGSSMETGFTNSPLSDAETSGLHPDTAD
jgi:hypothetical protein